MPALANQNSANSNENQPNSCPMENLLKLLSGPWTCLIIWNLSENGPTRFLELKRKVGKISSKVLTERLRMLESAEVIYRHYEPTVPPQVTYGMSPRGEELRTAFKTLHDIAVKWGDLDVKKSRNGKRRKDQAPTAMSDAAE